MRVPREDHSGKRHTIYIDINDYQYLTWLANQWGVSRSKALFILLEQWVSSADRVNDEFANLYLGEHWRSIPANRRKSVCLWESTPGTVERAKRKLVSEILHDKRTKRGKVPSPSISALARAILKDASKRHKLTSQDGFYYSPRLF